MRFWLDMGVDGFRLDAVPYLREREGTSNENLPETHATLREIRRVIDDNYRGRVLLAEANQWPEDVREYFGEGDECHMAYHFPLMPRLFMALAQEDRYPVVDIMRQTPEIPDNCQWAIFLRNHDELTLEMVTDRERDYMWAFFANDPRMRLNLGIRRRLAPLLENSRDRIELMSFLLLTMPGSPIVYYGDELGMGDNVYLGDRNGVRTPMQWTPDRNAGFSRADPQQLYLPPIMDPVYGFQTINVESQARNPHSLLNFNRRLIAMRKAYRAFGRGRLVFLEPGNRKVLAYLREYAGLEAGGEEQRVLCVANLARTPQAVELDLARHEGRVPVEITGRSAFPPIGRLPYVLTLPGHGFYAFELSVQAPAPEWHAERLPAADLPVLVLTEGWRTFLRGDGPDHRVRRAISTRSRAQLQEEVLLPYLRQRRWFAAKGDAILRVEVVEEQEWQAGDGSWLLTLLEVTLAGEPPQTYFLPLAIAWEEGGEHPFERLGAAALARVREKARMGLLHDAFADPLFCRALARAMGAGEQLALGRGHLRCAATPAWGGLAAAVDEECRPAAGEQTNTGVFFGQGLYLKSYRRLQPGINPELEMGHFLAASGYGRVAPLAGWAEFAAADGSASALAMLQVYVDNQGNAWDYTLDHLGRLFAADTWPGSDGERDVASLNRVYLLQMEVLGRRVAELHRALAEDRGQPDFRPEPVGSAEAAAWRAAALAALESTLALLAGRASSLEGEGAELARRVLALGDALAGRLAGLALDPHGLLKTRYHGDLHLGQVLVVHNDFVIVDFEGEPARPMALRRDKHLPLRDVAGMLRSFDYAARYTERRALRPPGGNGPALAAWRREAVDAFLAAYHQVLPPASPALPDFLELLVLEKLLYETRYELQHRPEWVPIPLAAMAELGSAGLG